MDTIYEIDQNVADAIFNYILYGLSPGSFTMAILIGDYEVAYLRAHPLLLRDNDYVKETIEFVKNELPPMAHGNLNNYVEWQAHKGLLEAPDEILVQVKLQCPMWLSKGKKKVL